MTANVKHLGAVTIGACVPVALQATAAATASINLSLPSLQARLAGALELALSLSITPPTLAGNLQAALDLVASLEAAVALGLPGVDFQAAGVATLIATLQVQVGALEASLSLIASIEANLLTAGIHLYGLDGPVAEIGTEVKNALADGLPNSGGPAAEAIGVMLLAVSSTAKVALQATFKTQ